MDDILIESLKNYIEEAMKNQNNEMPRLVEARKKALHPNASESDKKALALIEDEMHKLGLEVKRRIDLLQEKSGLSEKDLEEYEKHTQDLTETRYTRKDLTARAVETTLNIDNLSSNALDSLHKIVSKSWLEKIDRTSHRLDTETLHQPVAITRGIRLRSEKRLIHRFAQTVHLLEDHINGHQQFDFFSGALLIPQAIALHLALPHLDNARGNVKKRITNLWKKDSSTFDSALYELLVGSACIKLKRDIEFLEESKKEKTPDMRVGDLGFPLVIECKRRQTFYQYDIDDEDKVVFLFRQVRAEILNKGIAGVFEVEFTQDINTLDLVDISRQFYQVAILGEKSFEWGNVKFFQQQNSLSFPPTRAYSPDFLLNCFNWDSDMPSHDGIVCQVKPFNNFVVDTATEPIAIKWTISTNESLSRRARTISSLFNEAHEQIPVGEFGLIYICYPEGSRERIADQRTETSFKELRDWTSKITNISPAGVINRIYARALRNGSPDLIENAVKVASQRLDGETYFSYFPTLVFTQCKNSKNNLIN